MRALRDPAVQGLQAVQRADATEHCDCVVSLTRGLPFVHHLTCFPPPSAPPPLPPPLPLPPSQRSRELRALSQGQRLVMVGEWSLALGFTSTNDVSMAWLGMTWLGMTWLCMTWLRMTWRAAHPSMFHGPSIALKTGFPLGSSPLSASSLLSSLCTLLHTPVQLRFSGASTAHLCLSPSRSPRRTRGSLLRPSVRCTAGRVLAGCFGPSSSTARTTIRSGTSGRPCSKAGSPTPRAVYGCSADDCLR